MQAVGMPILYHDHDDDDGDDHNADDDDDIPGWLIDYGDKIGNDE